jgi:hypothetical protein
MKNTLLTLAIIGVILACAFAKVSASVQGPRIVLTSPAQGAYTGPTPELQAVVSDPVGLAPGGVVMRLDGSTVVVVSASMSGLGPWMTAASMPSVAVSGEYLYAIGGEGSGCVLHNEVYYAKACGAGLCHPVTGESASPWAATAPLLEGISHAVSAEKDGRIYLIGGNLIACHAARTSRVYRMIISSLQWRLT